MFKQAIITLIGFLAIASAFNATFEDSLFYINPSNALSYIMYQTRGGIIAYEIDVEPGTGSYMLVNLETKNTSVILADTVNLCGNPATNYDRLHYHAATDTLLFFCMANNDLLVIDQITYDVERTISTNIDTPFDEVKLVSQGYSLAILGIAEFSNNSELIIIDLQAYTIANHIVFNSGLGDGEQVVGYAASSKNSLYIMTSTCVDSQNYEYELKIYSMFLIGSSYTINNIASRNYSLVSPYYPIMTEFYSVGNLLVMSYNKIVEIVSAQGSVLGTYQGLAVNPKLSLKNVQHVALTVQDGNSDFYALLQDGTLLKFNVQNAGYTVETFATGIQDMHYITSNISSSSLLFTTDNYSIFNITDLQTSQPIYSTIAGATHFMTTDTTYAVTLQLEESMIFVFSRETNLLIYQAQIGSYYFYDANSNLISYLEYTDLSNIHCQVVQFNIQTTNRSVPFVLDPSYGTDCDKYKLYNVTNDLGDGNPQFLLDMHDNLLVKSEKFGLVKYGSFYYKAYISLPFVDYDTLTVYVAAGRNSIFNDVEIYVSTFNPSTNTFTLQGSTHVEDFLMDELFALPGKALIAGDSTFEEVDMSATLNKTVVNKNVQKTGDFFQDKTGAVYLMISSFDVYYANRITMLPGATAITVDGSAAGLCRYTLREQLDSQTFTMIRFFNVCSQEDLLSDSEIYA